MRNVSPSKIRRSSRVEIKIPVLLTSLEPRIQYSEVCQALVVNAHGCGIRSRRRLEAGIAVQMRMTGGAQTTARIVGSQSITSQPHAWTLGVSFDSPKNFFLLRPCPE